MPFDRRTLLGGGAAAAALGPFLALENAMAALPPMTEDEAFQRAADAHMQLMSVPGLNMHGSETVSLLIYPGFTALDLIGPHHFLTSMMGSRVQLVTNQPTLEPVTSDLGLSITPTATLETSFAAPTMLFVPGGGGGTVAAMQHAPTLAWLKDRAPKAKLVTSVCIGSLVLGAAGLLKGRRATSHWAARDVLSDFGATPVAARVVKDGNVITGAGVSAGLDFGLAVVEQLRGRPYAQALMLQAEYSPEPPFRGGSPATTDPAIVAPLEGMLAPVVAKARAVARRQTP